jgi:predicted transposase YdaD
MVETFAEWVARMGRLEGKLEGRLEGKLEAKIETIQILLNVKFKDKNYYNIIQSISNIEIADKVLIQILKSDNLIIFIEQLTLILEN